MRAMIRSVLPPGAQNSEQLPHWVRSYRVKHQPKDPNLPLSYTQWLPSSLSTAPKTHGVPSGAGLERRANMRRRSTRGSALVAQPTRFSNSVVVATGTGGRMTRVVSGSGAAVVSSGMGVVASGVVAGSVAIVVVPVGVRAAVVAPAALVLALVVVVAALVVDAGLVDRGGRGRGRAVVLAALSSRSPCAKARTMSGTFMKSSR
mmetsp:Transcript_24766/g.71275  ORF Transcript_24766/g.71275 Transcript_24766/m.71275 type:complete len:204 (+) Transcript_24766:150-761(+)